MAVTVIKRPQGHILDSTREDALVTDDYGNQGALFDNPSHGLVDGDYVYVESDVENYNGFWYVEQVNSRFFWLREYATGSLLQWVVDATVYYYKAVSTHGWSCVHLPIVYKLSNDRWPTNSVDTARTETGTVDSNGYCQVTVDGDIKSSGSANELDYIEVQTGDLAGVWQIIEYTSDTVFTLNIPYSAANDTALSGATLQYYYNNYNVRVRVFAGLSSSHYWTASKPYEQILDLKLVPDTSNLVTVNINEYLKKQIEVISNNLQQASLPNDIDSFCEFYISTAETYDETDGETQTTSTPSFTADSGNFEGVAVNSMLQFKNQHSGYLSEYLAYDSRSKFLTLFDEPRLFAGCYYDISFLSTLDSSYDYKLEYYTNGGIVSTVQTEISQYDLGKYSLEIAAPSSPTEDRVDVTIIKNNSVLGLASWTNNDGGNIDWTLSSTPFVSLNVGQTSEYLEAAFIGLAGKTFTFTLSWEKTTSSSFGNLSIHIALIDISGNIIDEDVFTKTGTGDTSYNETVSLNTNNYPSAKLYIWVDGPNNSPSIGQVTAVTLTSEAETTVSETKTINIDTECSFQDLYLTWKNYLGGMDYWKFTAQKDYISDVEGVTETTNNILPTWPNSYGSFADTIDKETSRTSRDKIIVRSQNVTEDEMNAIRYIVSSPLVQIMTSKNDRRTVKVNSGSFVWKRDEDKLYAIEFEISYTNTIPSQSL